MSRASAPLLLAIACACSAREPTEIMLTVDSDLVVSEDLGRREIDYVRVRVFRLVDDYDGPEPFVLDERRGDNAEELIAGQLVRIDRYVYEHRWSNDFRIGADGFRLPLEVGIAPENRDYTRTTYLEAVALNGGEVVVRTAVRTRFVTGRTVRVILWLSASCVGRECPPETVCRQADCVGVDIDPMCLPSASSDAAVGPTDCTWHLSDAGLSCDPACATGQTCVSGRCVTECTPACVPPLFCIDGTCMEENVDAGTCDGSCACTDGQTRMLPCGDCGMQVQECVSRTWVDVGTCTGEGVCTPDDTTNQSRGCACGSESRDGVCTSSCTWSWSGWSGCPACCECSGGATENRSAGSCGACNQGTQIETRTCDGCHWGGWSPSGCDESGIVCRPGDWECGTCGVGFWRTCNPSTCTWYSCGPKPSCS